MDLAAICVALLRSVLEYNALLARLRGQAQWALHEQYKQRQDLVNLGLKISYLFILFVYFFNIHSILQSIYQHLLRKWFSQNT